MNNETNTSHQSLDKYSVLVVSNPGDFRSSLATLLRSLPEVKAIHFAEDSSTARAALLLHQPIIAVLDGDYLNRSLSQVQESVRSEARDTIVVVMSEHEHESAGTPDDHFFTKGTRPDHLLTEIQALLARRDQQRTVTK